MSLCDVLLPLVIVGHVPIFDEQQSMGSSKRRRTRGTPTCMLNLPNPVTYSSHVAVPGAVDTTWVLTALTPVRHLIRDALRKLYRPLAATIIQSALRGYWVRYDYRLFRDKHGVSDGWEYLFSWYGDEPPIICGKTRCHGWMVEPAKRLFVVGWVKWTFQYTTNYKKRNAVSNHLAAM